MTSNSEKIVAKFKLTIELVPTTVWFSSLYRLISRKRWQALKKEVYEKESKKCYICGSTNPPFELHEFWEYDDENHVQKLIGVHHLCRLCHMVKHMGFAIVDGGIICLSRRGCFTRLKGLGNLRSLD